MTPFLRFFARVLSIGLLSAGLVGLAHAQSAQMSDGGGAQVSDASGVSDVSGSMVLGQRQLTKAVLTRIQSRATGLAQSVQRGEIAYGASTIAVPPSVGNLLTQPNAHRIDGPGIVAALVAADLPEAQAQTLVDAVAELLATPSIDAATFAAAVNGLNDAVEVAPASFLVEPPHEFVVLHTVLSDLLTASS